jgi:hypothetical protein
MLEVLYVHRKKCWRFCMSTERNSGGSVSVSDLDLVGSTFNLALDPGSVFGIWIQIPDPDV